MVLPLAWILGALTAASTGANFAAQRKVSKARTDVMAEERQRRKIQQDRANAAAQSTADAFLQTKDKEAARAAEVAQLTNAGAPAPVAAPTGAIPQALTAPTQATSTVGEITTAQDRARAQNTALAKLNSFGDVMADNRLIAGRNAQDIGQSQNFTQGWQQNVLPALLEHANSAGKDWATAADVMKLAATVMTPFALAKSGISEAATAAGKSAHAASLAQPNNLFDPFNWQTWLRPSGPRPPLL